MKFVAVPIEQRRRRFFDEFAREKGFHPLKEFNRWYDVSKKEIVRRKVWQYMLALER
jgi:hypothetical protein